MLARADALLARTTFLNYRFEVRDSHGGVFIKAVYDEPDTYTGVIEPQHTRKWLLSPHMTDSEIVQTVFKLCLTSMEHRTREGFVFAEARVFSPHFDVWDLVKLCKDDRENTGGRLL